MKKVARKRKAHTKTKKWTRVYSIVIVCWLADSDADQLENIGAERWEKLWRVAIWCVVMLFQLMHAKREQITNTFYIPFIPTVKREYSHVLVTKYSIPVVFTRVPKFVWMESWWKSRMIRLLRGSSNNRINSDIKQTPYYIGVQSFIVVCHELLNKPYTTWN